MGRAWGRCPRRPSALEEAQFNADRAESEHATAPCDEMMSTVLIFMSHASKDSDPASIVAGQLASLGHSAWLAEHDNRAGERLSEKVEGQLRAADAVVVLLTKAGFDSRYVQQEIGFARGLDVPVIPLVSPEVGREDLGMFNDIEYIGFDPTAPAAALERLARRVEQLAEQQAEEAASKQRERSREVAIVLGVVAVLCLIAYASPS
jgi:TIR domain